MSPTAAVKPAGREFGAAILVLAAGGGLLLASAGRTWVTGEAGASGPVAAMAVDVTGGDLSGVMAGVGWAALAGTAGLYAARGPARRLVGALLALGGVFALVQVWNATRSGALAAALADAAGGAAGAARAVGEPVLHATGPAMAAAGAVAVAVAGAAAVIRATLWPGMGSRYDRDAAPSSTRADTPADLWRSLDAGDDPTLDARGGVSEPERSPAEGGTTPAPLASGPAEPKENH
ncbi:Trp biosynthesis-associated membrane protein [Nocardiopsis sp. CNT312]|uniref:Trp biosynthesis-associated membrane protein n=1 Tax=Nocardiopsis sp. CNT312 TaxID=1137268 RepID=UPI00048EE62E|nr:Trp biosynthesis-associated membrane protein [Nocardiopsis sp. CNT312]